MPEYHQQGLNAPRPQLVKRASALCVRRELFRPAIAARRRDHENVPVMELPSFSQWVLWPQRYLLKDCNHPGLYLLRRFDVEPRIRLGPVDAELLYIGITCDRTLEKRWYEFDRSAYKRKTGHSGGLTFNSLYCGNETAETHPWLYVSCLPIFFEEPKLSAYIQFVERWLIWEHVQRHGKMPECNCK